MVRKLAPKDILALTFTFSILVAKEIIFLKFIPLLSQ